MQILPMPKLIIFDVDGTIFNTDEIYFRLLKEQLRKYSFDLTEQFYGLNDLEDSVYELGLPKEVSEVIKEEIRAYYYSDEILQELEFKKDVQETLDVLSENFRFAIGSGEREGQIKKYLAHKGITDIFEFVGHGQMAEGRKNNPEYFQIIADNCEVSLADCIMIGDTLHDANAAKLGCRTIIIPSMFTRHITFPSKVELVQTFSELPNYLRLINHINHLIM